MTQYKACSRCLRPDDARYPTRGSLGAETQSLSSFRNVAHCLECGADFDAEEFYTLYRKEEEE